MLIALLLAQTMAAPAPAPAATAAVCPATPAALPADYAGWSAAMPVAAAAERAAIGDSILTVGRGARASLQPAGALKLQVPPKKPLTATAHGGLFGFEAASAGRYRVALGAAVWVDVVANGVALPAVAHGHGPDCTPIRKFVEFDLKPGRYLLQVTGEPTLLALEVLKVS